MRTPAWKAVLGAGSVAAVLCAFLGPTAQGALLLISCLTAGISLLIGVRTHRTTEPGPWVGLALSTFFLFLASVLRAFEVDNRFGALLIPDWVSAVAYLLLISSAHRLKNLRSKDLDPTNLVDAIAVTLAVGIVYWASYTAPYLADSLNPAPARDSLLVFCSLDIALLFVVTRLAIGPGARTPSYHLLGVGTAGTFISDIVISSAESAHPFTGAAILGLAVPAVALFACSAAGLHPSMAEITKPAAIREPKISTARMILMMAATVLPPVVVIVRLITAPELGTTVAILGAACGLIAVLMVIRFAGIAKNKENAASLERLLAEAASSLATATVREGMPFLIASEAVKVACSGSPSASVAVATLRDSDWVIVERAGGDSLDHDSQRDSPEEQLLAALLRSKKFQVVQQQTERGLAIAVFPLVTHNELRGALLVTSEVALAASVLRALQAWANQAALALEAADLRESLQKQRSDRRFRALVERSDDLILVMNGTQTITFQSPSAEKYLKAGDSTVRAFVNAVHDADRAGLVTLLENVARGKAVQSTECRLVAADGEVSWYDVAASDMRTDADVGGVVINAHNITMRKQLEENLRHQVLHDPLTGIANRVLLRNRLQHALDARPGETATALLFIDIDEFKDVNDVFGPSVGDELLRVLAFRLQAYLRPEDTAARLNGDEFAVLLEDLDDAVMAEQIAERLLGVISEPLYFDNRKVSVTASIGIAYGDEERDCDSVLRNADTAMHHAKWGGKGAVVLFDENMHQEAVDRLDFKADLGNALARQEFSLNYQPLVRMHDEGLVGFEALLRWNSPTRGFVSPADFIPLAEETGLIVEIGAWVTQESLAQLERWNDASGNRLLKMSLNVSPLQLKSDAFVKLVSSVLMRRRISPEQVILELTETAMLDEPDAQERLFRLRNLGVGIAADDFGTGFASYASLQQLPFTIIKVDRSLINGIAEGDGRAAAQVRSIVDMAHATGLQVVAEGIEHAEQRDVLVSMNCDRGQGYLFSRPLPADAAESWVVAQGAPSRLE